MSSMYQGNKILSHPRINIEPLASGRKNKNQEIA
jgi:hypothetical protein